MCQSGNIFGDRLFFGEFMFVVSQVILNFLVERIFAMQNFESILRGNFSIRKFKTGVASVLLSTSMLALSHQVATASAQEVVDDTVNTQVLQGIGDNQREISILPCQEKLSMIKLTVIKAQILHLKSLTMR